MDEPKSIPRLQERLKNLDALMANPEYKCFIAATQEQIDGVKQSLLVVRPINPEKTALVMELYGKLDVLTDNLSLFESARVDLEQQLSNLLDEATQITQKPKETE